MDEAGRGPWAGPVVAAAVSLPLGARLGVRIDDSKRLSRQQRRRAFDVIVERAEVGVGVVAADAIDESNILHATLGAMSTAVCALPSLPELLLVDGLQAPAVDMPCQPIVGGDKHSYLIGCASIVAKVIRDDLMSFYDTVYPAYGFGRHQGYGTAWHGAQLERWGPCALHRMSFRPVADRRFAAWRGKRAEDIAARYLAEHGYAIEARNVRYPIGEIDLVAHEGGTLCFVEVRAREAGALVGPLESVTPRKRRRIIRAAEWYLVEHPDPAGQMRFDVVAIDWQGAAPSVELFRGAFDASSP